MPILAHRDLGGAGLPPLVILHGLLGSSRNWQAAGRDLAAHFHVCALDLRNHGESFHAPGMDYTTIAADVLAWMDAQGLARAVLMGHSMGGKAAMRLASIAPERVGKLLVVDIAPKAYSKFHTRNFDAMSALDLTTLLSRQEAEERLALTVEDWAMRKFLLTNLERADDGRFRWSINLPGITAALSTLEASGLREEDRFAGEAFFIVGGKSRHFVHGEDEALVLRHFPRARFAVIAGSGHNPHFDARERFVEEALRLLGV